MKKLFNGSKKKKILIIVIGILVLAGAILSRNILGGPEATLAEAIAIRQDLTEYYSFSGNIESSDVQSVMSTTNEPVKKFYVAEGDHVNVGDLLYEIDSNTIQSTLTSASTSLSNAKISYASKQLDYERKQQLYEIGGVTLQELELAKNALDTAKNSVTEAQEYYAQAQNQYEDTMCFAEVSGEVSELYVNENDSITQGTLIMDVMNFDNLEINVKVDEYDLSAVSEGMEVEVYIEAIDKTVIGSISEIARSASVSNGVSYFETTVTLPKDPDLRVGLSAEVKVVTESAKDAVTVPIEAIQYEGSGSYVQSYNDNRKLELIPVTVGINNGTDIEITKGLSEGDSVYYSRDTESQEASLFSGPPPGQSERQPGAEQ